MLGWMRHSLKRRPARADLSSPSQGQPDRLSTVLRPPLGLWGLAGALSSLAVTVRGADCEELNTIAQESASILLSEHERSKLSVLPFYRISCWTTTSSHPQIGRCTVNRGDSCFHCRQLRLHSDMNHFKVRLMSERPQTIQILDLGIFFHLVVDGDAQQMRLWLTFRHVTSSVHPQQLTNSASTLCDFYCFCDE